MNPVAEELGLVDAHGPGAVLALAANVPAHPPLPTTSESRSATNNQSDAGIRLDDRPEAHFYGYLLDACEKLFEGEFDQTTFEENMRFLFGTKVSLSFTSPIRLNILPPSFYFHFHSTRESKEIPLI